MLEALFSRKLEKGIRKTLAPKTVVIEYLSRENKANLRNSTIPSFSVQKIEIRKYQ